VGHGRNAGDRRREDGGDRDRAGIVPRNRGAIVDLHQVDRYDRCRRQRGNAHQHAEHIVPERSVALNPDGPSSATLVSTLRTHDLTKSYGGRTVVRGVSIEVASGEIVGLLGPSGAGKTRAFAMTVG